MLNDNNSDEDIDLLASRNFECILDLPAERKLDFWQVQRMKEEEEIRNINFEQYALRQAELEAEEAEMLAQQVALQQKETNPALLPA